MKVETERREGHFAIPDSDGGRVVKLQQSSRCGSVCCGVVVCLVVEVISVLLWGYLSARASGLSGRVGEVPN